MSIIWRKVEDDDAFDEETDTLKFRLVLRPETDENNRASSADAPAGGGAEAAAGAAEGGSPPLHRLMIQTVGGRSCSQVFDDYTRYGACLCVGCSGAFERRFFGG